jgi:ABC-type polysaccharide/polyol phosphate export permease
VASVVELWGYRELIANLAQRELRAKYKKSLLGWGWSILNPAATLGIYTLVFGFFLKFEVPPSQATRLNVFALYLFAALIIWNFFNAVLIGSMAALVSAGPLIRKVYFPAECTILATMFAALLQTLVETAVLVVIMGIVGNVSWTFLLFPLVLALLALFTTGTALVVSLLNVYFRDISYLIGIGLSLLFYATPIIYPLEVIPSGAQTVLRLNPLTQFVEASRQIFYVLRAPSFLSLAGLTAVSLTTFAAGWLIFATRGRDVSEEV